MAVGSRSRDTRPRVLLVYPCGNIDVNPTLAVLLQRLSETGCSVDVLLEEAREFPAPASFGRGVRLAQVPRGTLQPDTIGSSRVARRWVAARRPVAGGDWGLAARLWLGPETITNSYDAVLGVDPTGLAVAHRLVGAHRVPLAYLSFELMYEDELISPDEQRIRRLELAAVGRVQLALIQDEERAIELESGTGIPRSRMVCVPVAPAPSAPVRTEWLRERLGIPADRRIVLYMGAVSAWTGRDELPEMVASWPERFVLALHSSSTASWRPSPAMRRLMDAGRVFVSSQPAPRAELPNIAGSADFGLAPYRATGEYWETGKNVEHLGLASGKVSYYALCGVPILARRLGVYERKFPVFNAGRVYDVPAETGSLLTEMESNYAAYSSGARRFYEERLDPTRGIEEFVLRLQGCVDSYRSRSGRRRTDHATTGQPEMANSSVPSTQG